MKLPLAFKKAVREFQLSVSLGVVALILFAVITSSIALHLGPVPITSVVGARIFTAILGRGTLLLIGPALAAGSAYAFGTGPWGAGAGTIGFVELALTFNEWARGGASSFDESNAGDPLAFGFTDWIHSFGSEMHTLASHLYPMWLVSLAAAVVSFQAAKWGAARAAAHAKATAVPTPASEAAAVDFAEQMRAAQERAKASKPAPDALPQPETAKSEVAAPPSEPPPAPKAS